MDNTDLNQFILRYFVIAKSTFCVFISVYLELSDCSSFERPFCN